MTPDRDLLLFAAALLALASALLMLGRLDGAQWLTSLQWTLGLLVTGKVAGPIGEGLRSRIAR